MTSGFSDRAIEQLKADHRELRSLLKNAGAQMRQLREATPAIHGYKFVNAAKETVPAYGCMRITGAVIGYDTYFTCAKPNDEPQDIYLVNGPSPVQPGCQGYAQKFDEPNGVLTTFSSASAAPAYGEFWGPTDNSWKLTEGNSGFMILGHWKGSTVAVQKRDNSMASIEYYDGVLKEVSTEQEFAYNDPGYISYANHIGSESEVGITHDSAESTPSTNGNFTFTKSGFYRLHLSLQLNDSTPGSTVPTETFETSSSGTPAHTHTVEVNARETIANWQAVVARIYSKAAGGSWALFDTALYMPIFRWWNGTHSFTGERSLQANFAVGDKLKLEARVITGSAIHFGHSNFTVTRLGDTADDTES